MIAGMKRDAFSEYHPAVNFLYFTVIIGMNLLIPHPVYVFAGAAAAFGYYGLLNRKRRLKTIFSLLPMGVLIALINPVFNTHGSTLLFTVFGRPYTLEALYYGINIAVVFISMLLWFGCCSAVLTADKFTCLFVYIIPSLSLLLVMVLRLIPNLFGKAAHITNARKAIGKGAAEQSSMKEKIQDGMTVLSSLTDWALESSVVTGDSMRARGYGSAGRTSFMVYRMTSRDWVMLCLITALSLYTALRADTAAVFIPELVIAPLNPGLSAYCALCSIPITLHIKENIQWHILISKI